MLKTAGELAQGVLSTWPVPHTIARAVAHVAIGAPGERRMRWTARR